MPPAATKYHHHGRMAGFYVEDDNLRISSRRQSCSGRRDHSSIPIMLC